VRKLADAGVASLKIEGRMKSALYVASVTRYYRDILDNIRTRVTGGDLETVFSRRTTRLYFDGKRESPVDPESIGHLGAEIGVVKRITKDREGLAWLRFHTARGLEKHDGLQFEATVDGRHVGMGIVEMRQAISRRPVFEVNAGVDVEVRVAEDVAAALGVDPACCLMVGNDVDDDLPAAQVGMQVFLLTDCLINKRETNLDSVPHGDFSALRAYLDALRTEKSL
jgi:hypothetical protein